MTDQFGPYLLHERLGVGGMAEVFRAERGGPSGFTREVCIKRVLPALCEDPAFVALFEEEARVGALLRHGNVVAIDDFGEVGGRWFLCLEWMSGGDLASLLRAVRADGAALPTDVVLHVAAEVLRGLDYVHRKVDATGRPMEIVHRDVSPHNVLLTRDGGVKLGDFGIARGAGRRVKTTGGVVRGKVAYMAPEQVRGIAVDARADLFALGITVFEALAGTRPFEGANEVALVRALLRGEHPPLADVPAPVAAWVDRLLAVDRARRTATAHEALTTLIDLGASAAAATTLAAIVRHYRGREGERGFDPAALPRARKESTEARATRADAATRTMRAWWWGRGRRRDQ